MSENFNYCHVVGKTDVGKKRAANEDNMYNAITQNGLVSVVCDGMGGHVGGATASMIAVSTIIENLNNVYYDDPRIAIGESIDRANRAIIQKTEEQPELAGMGSTCVLLIVRGGKVYIGHVGDSRIYLVRSKRIVQLTKDHSYVQMLVDHGDITKEQAEHHPRKNEITNALGIPNMSPATVAEDAIIPEAGDCFVLCSDGLSGMVSDDAICKVISRQVEMNAQERVDKLVAMANENGGVDNITIQLVEFSVSPNIIVEKKFPVWAKIVCIVSVLLALCVGGYFILIDPTPSSNNDKYAKNGSCIETIEYPLGEIPYQKNTQIVELVFSGTLLELKRDNESLCTFEDVSFDPATFVVETQNIKSQYNNSLLTFTDKHPGDTISFSITTTDKQKIYKFIFTVDKSVEEQRDYSNFRIPENNNFIVKDKNEEKPFVEEVVEVDSVPITLEYDKLEKDDKILLNYSAKPKVLFKEDEISVSDNMIDENIEVVEYDDVYWEMLPIEKNRQLSFKFKGESSDKKHKFAIRCKLKDSENQVIILVEIVPKKDIVNDNKGIRTQDTDTIFHTLKYNNPKDYSEIQFTYVETPYIVFNGTFCSLPIDGMIDSIANIPHNSLWDVEHNEKSCKLTFKYKGDVSEAPQGILIPFYKKGSNSANILSIRLSPVNDEDNVDNKSDTENGDNDNTQSEQETDKN